MEKQEVMELTPNALKTLEKRCLLRDEDGNVIETPEALFRRVAHAVAKADLGYGKSESEVETLEDEFFSIMASLKFLPNSPTLVNAGTDMGQLSACFVLPVGDSMEEIFDAVKYTAIIHKSGGGTGFGFSRLRPKNDIVNSTKRGSSGPVAFMGNFDTATESVKQGGVRRGANMGLLRVDHPDIMEFISCKSIEKQLKNFNISVGLTEAFMKAEAGDLEYDLINPRGKKVSGKLNAREVFGTIVEKAWKNGEPGIVFLDRMNEGNPTPALGEIESTNPCGEQPLLPYESCNLGSINLDKFVTDGKVDWDMLGIDVDLAVHFLDNVIDVNKFPLPMIEEMTKGNRKIGLGVMGWADMLIRLNIPYNSDEAINLAEEVMCFIRDEARMASERLAEERGVFPNWDLSVWKDRGRKQRNATVTTIAPTGTLSIIAGCSSGIEPIFAVSFVKNVLEGEKLIEVNPHFTRVLKEKKIYFENMDKIAETGSIAKMEEFPAEIRELFVTAHDITPLSHVKMQAAFQTHTDNAVSKTVNLCESSTTKDVENVYRYAYNLGCKGVTIYRDGSRDEQVLTTGKNVRATKELSVKLSREAGVSEESARKALELAMELVMAIPRVREKRKRPTKTKGETPVFKTGCGDLYITVNQDDNGKPFEVFTNMGKAGGCAASQGQAVARLISLALRSDVEAKEIVKQLKGISCNQPSWGVASCSDAIAKAIEGFDSLNVADSNGFPSMQRHSGIKVASIMGACPECGGAVEHEGGCAVCHSCGFTKCN